MASRILVVNDPSICQLILDSLRSLFCTVIVSDAGEAIDKIETSCDIDLLVMDMDMKHGDPLKFLEKIGSLKKSETIHKIILTDLNENYKEIFKDIERSKTGTTDFMVKPLTASSLTTRIALHLEMVRIQQILDDRTDDSSLKLDAILEQAPIGIVLAYGEEPSCDIENDPAIINPMFEKITGRKRKELLELGWAKITHPDDMKKDVDSFNELLLGEINGYVMEKRFLKPDGTIVWTDITVAPLKLKNNTKYKHICLVQDITARKTTEDFLRESERSKSVLLSNLPGIAYRCNYDRDRTMQFVSAGCYDLTGYRPESLLNSNGLSFNEIIKEEYREIVWLEWEKVLPLHTAFRMEYEIITADGESKWVLETGQGVYGIDGSAEAIEGMIIDITGRKIQELKLRYMSEHSSVTGLLNRRSFNSILSSGMSERDRENRAVFILNVKKINWIRHSYGYSFSEQVICSMARKLSLLMRDNIRLFQISIERFALYITSYENEEDLISLCREIFGLISDIEIINAIGCSIGIIKLDGFDSDPEAILKNASIAAEIAEKQDLFSFCFFDKEHRERAFLEAEIEKELMLSAGKDEDNIFLLYQPIFNSETGRISGFEALARMKSEKLGTVSPLDFIPLAEELMLIVPLGIKILRMACGFVRQVVDLGHPELKIAVNVSPIQLFRSDFVHSVIDVIKETGTDPANICLEVTESVFADNFELINRKLEKLQEIGISISIDDFGTGYSSLARERELNVDCLKIDRTFVEKLEYIEPCEGITCDIISMAHKLGHVVIAEGVETEKQKQYLIYHGCDYLQGYLFSKPVDPMSALDMLKERG